MAWLGAIRDRQGAMRLPGGDTQFVNVILGKYFLLVRYCHCIWLVWLAVDYSSQLVLDVTLKLLSRPQSKRPMTEFIQDIIIQNLSWVIKQCF